MGTEWQLSLLLAPFLLIARRWGWAALLGTAVLLALPYPGLAGKVVHALFHPTFTMCFVIGMATARLVRGGRLVSLPSKRTPKSAPFATVAGAASAAALLFSDYLGPVLTAWAAAFAAGALCCLIACRPGIWPDRFLSCGLLRRVATFSYSLYLIHLPLLALLADRLGIHGETAFYAAALPGIPVIVGFSYLFSRLFEVPFQRKKTGTVSSVADAPPVVPSSGFGSESSGGGRQQVAQGPIFAVD